MSNIYSSFRCLLMALLVSGPSMIFGQSLTCNGGVNISMDSNCEVVVDARVILKGLERDADPTEFLLSVQNLDGTIPTDVLVYDSANNVFSDTIGPVGEFLRFLRPGSFTISVRRKSDGVNCWSNLVIEDKLPPRTNDCPCDASDLVPDDDCIFNCTVINEVLNSQDLTGLAGINPTFSDNCDNIGNVSFSDDLVEDTICGRWTITRTWSYSSTDADGVESNKNLNCIQRFIFNNIGIDAVMPPSNKVVVSCGTNTDPQSLRNFFSDPNTFSNPDLDSALIRAYPTLVDTLPDGSLFFQMIGGGTNRNASSTFCGFVAGFTDSPIIPVCGDTIGFKFVRTWDIIDWCTRQNLPPVTQVIKVEDNEAPTFMILDTIAISSTDPYDCDVDIIVPAPTSLMDNCSDLTQLTWIAYVQIGGSRIVANAANGFTLMDIGIGVYRVIYEVTDPCGNSSIDDAVLVVRDNVKPVALSKRKIKVTFSSFEGECTAKVFTSNIDANSFDSCDEEVDLSIRRFGSDDSFGPSVKFDGDDITGVSDAGVPFGKVDIELKVVDQSGNFNLAWTTVHLEDRSTDVSIICGDTLINVLCTEVLDSLILDQLPTVVLNGCTDRALPVVHTIRSNSIDSRCHTGVVEVDYFIEGSTSVICSKVFNFGDTTRLMINFPPAEIIVDCTETDFGDVMIIGGSCNNALVSERLREFETPLGSGYCRKILREITVVDWCTYMPNTDDTTGIYRFLQTIKVEDFSLPVIECNDFELSAGPDCYVTGITLTATGTDIGMCDDILTWEATLDTDGDGDFDLDLEVLVDGDSVEVVVMDTLLVGDFNIRWRALDGCGNGDEAVCTLSVVDDIPPSPQCISNVSTASMSTDGTITIWAEDFDLNGNSSDNCTSDLTYSFSGDDRTDASRTFDCSDLSDGISGLFELTVYVWDDSDNNDFCMVQLRVDDNLSDACPDGDQPMSNMIAGTVSTYDGERLSSARVINTSMSSQTIADRVTSDEGLYAFEENVTMADYEISASKSDDYLNGVTTLDLILIQRHILGYTRFDNPYHMIAADVSGDTRISSIDLVQLRNLILGRSDVLPIGQSWKFIDAHQDIRDGHSPWPLQEKLYISQLASEQINQDFTAIKIGDVNGTAVVQSTLIGSGRSAERIVLNIDNKKVRKGEIHQLTLDFGGIDDIYGVQLHLQLKKGKWLDVHNNSASIKDDFVSIKEGGILLSWPSATSLKEDQTVTLIFEAMADGVLADFVSINDEGIPSELYMGHNIDNYQLSFNYVDHGQSDFVLYQNIPNPFDGRTTIPFSIGKPGIVEISIFDLTGRQLLDQSGYYNSGRHTIDIDATLIGESGILYYQISFDNMVATKKMIAIQ